MTIEELKAEVRRLSAENAALRQGARLITEPLPEDVARLRADYLKLKSERVSYKAKLVDDRWAIEREARLKALEDAKDAALDACDTGGCGAGCVNAILDLHRQTMEAK